MKGTDVLEQVQRRVNKVVWRWRSSILGEIKHVAKALRDLLQVKLV